ncbi:non-ribosomal peptide synthetase [Paenibacillus alvei]|nr:non-ribosomal peptide synthetase [Paenibacillus alvei]
MVTFEIGRDVTEGLQRIASETGATMYMVLLAAYTALLSKYTGQEDIIVGTPIAGRPHADLDNLIGMFVGTLALRNYPVSDKTFTEFVKDVKEDALKAFEHQDYPFEDLVEKLDVQKDLSRNPLFDTMFVMQNADQMGVPIHSLEIVPYGAEQAAAKFDLTLNAVEAEGDLRFGLQYCTALFHKETAERMARHFKCLLQAVVEQPARSLGEIEILLGQERQQILEQFNDTRSAYPKEKTIQELFEEQVEKTPEQLAVVLGERRMSYRELNERANRLAWTLKNRGIKPETIVAIMVDRSLEMVVGIMGVLKAGGAYLPIDPEYPEERIDYMLKDSGTEWLLTQEPFVQQIGNHFTGVVLDLHNPATYAVHSTNPDSLCRADNLAYVMYTSGSTGKPKGTLTTHANITKVVIQTNYIDITAEDRILQLSNYAFDGSTFDIFGALLNGARLVMADKETLLDVSRLVEMLEQEGITVFFITTALFNLVAELEPSIFSKVRKVLFGGEKVSVPHVQRALQAAGEDRIIHVYGPTEATVFSTYYPVRTLPVDAYDVPIGKPLANTQVYVLSSTGQLQPIGVPGELCIAGDGLARGYLTQLELTKEKFIKHPFASSERVYRTGDLARWLPDGNLEYVGRIDHQVKIRGYRIELGEIEARLQRHDRVKEAIVLARKSGSGDLQLCAYVVGEGALDVAELRRFMGRHLPSYMIPSFFMQLEKMPLTPNGKINRQSLPAPEGYNASGVEYVEPRTELEMRLAELWKNVLGIERIGIKDNFFDLGGHSLKASTLVAQMHKELNVNVPLRVIFQTPTLEQLAQTIVGMERQMHASIERVETREYYPVSSAQKRLYILNQLEGAALSYNMPGAYNIKGTLDVERLERAFRGLIARHESLRTSFEMVEGEPVQRVHEQIAFMVEVEHQPKEALSGSGQLPDEQEIARQAGAFLRPFDLGQAPLLRVGLMQLSEDSHLLLFDMHHIISDGVSLNVLIQEFARLYEGESLPELRIQYKDYAVWQQALAQSEAMQRQEKFWLETFAGEIPVLDLQTDYARPAVQSFEGDAVSFDIGREVTGRLRLIATETGATMYMVLLAAYTAFLSKYTGQEDVVVGTPIAGRLHADLEPLIGMFVGTLAMRNYPSGEQTFAAFVRDVKERALAAFENQDYPFEELVEKLAIRRDLSRNPLFDTMFTMQSGNRSDLPIRGLEFTASDTEYSAAKFDLTLNAIEIDDGEERLTFSMQYRTALFCRETVERMAGHFKHLLQAVAEQPEQLLREISILPQEERNQIIVDFNDTAAAYPSEKTIHELFEAQVEKTPNQVALALGEERITYQELNEKANRLARVLRENGVKADEVVGILADRSLEMAVGIFGVLKAGGAYMPIDPEYPEERIRYMLEDSGANLLLVQAHLKQQAEVVSNYKLSNSAASQNADVGHSVMDGNASAGRILTLGSEILERGDGTNAEAACGPNHLAYVIYTSGTTGLPKGVMIEHRGAVNALQWRKEEYGFNETDKVLQLFSFAFDGFVTSFFTPLVSGSQVILLPEVLSKDPVAIKEVITEQRITSFICIPLLYAAVLECLTSDEMKSLRIVTLAGDKTTPEIVQASVLKSARTELVNEYGPTENSVVTSCLRHLNRVERITIGRPISNVQVYVLNRYGQIQPSGLAGEICVAGSGLARGYLNRPQLTAERFVAHPFISGERVYRTGDLGRWLQDGKLEYLGRIDHQVKIRGYRIELGEVENQLMRHEHVKETAVIAQQDEQGDSYLCAYVIAEGTVDANELRRFLGQQLPKYMIPSFFVQLEQMPLTPNGKLDRLALPAPDGNALLGAEYVAPRTVMEARLAGIWQRVLGIERVGVRDSFFDLGGHSLKATMLVSQMHKELNVNVPLRTVFQAPTLEQLAQAVMGMEQQLYASIEPVEVRAYYPVSSAQKRLYILNQLEGAAISYNMPGIYAVEGPLDAARLEQAFRELVARHESLRTSFEMVDGEPVQRVHDQVSFAVEKKRLPQTENHLLEAESLQGTGRPSKAERITETMEMDIAEQVEAFVRPFDLEQAPLLRVGLVEVEANRHLLLFDMHHIVSDGVSMGVLVQELTRLYEGDGLPELRIQYKDYAAWQQSLAQSETMQKQEAFWLETFAGDIPVLELPTDYARPALQSFAGDVVHAELDSDVTAGLRRIAADTGATMYMVLLAAYTALLSKYSGQEDIVVGTPIAGRPHADLEPLIGMFVGTLAMRNYPAGERTFAEFVCDVKERALQAFENQDYPFEELVEKLDVRKDLSRNPLFDTMFAMQGEDGPDIGMSALRFTPYGTPHTVAKFDLTLNAHEAEHGILLSLEYATALYGQATMTRMSEHLVHLLREVAANASIRLDEIRLISEAEREQLLTKFQPEAAAEESRIPENAVFYRLFEEQAKRTPEQVAAVYEEQRISYGELNERANQLARVLRQDGVHADDIVGLMIDRSLDMLIGVLAVMKAGGAYLPIDPDYPEERIRYMLQDSGAKLLVLPGRLRDRVPSHVPCDVPGQASGASSEEAEEHPAAKQQEGTSYRILLMEDEAIAREDTANLPPLAGPQHLAYVIYTSGSTGNPKGVMVEHRSYAGLAHAWKQAYRLDALRVSLLQLASFSFDVFAGDMARALLWGGQMVICPSDVRMDPASLYERIRDYGINILESTPALVLPLMQYIEENDLDISEMKLLILGSDVCPAGEFQKLVRRFGSSMRILNSYGVTEACIDSSFYEEGEEADGAERSRGNVPIGRPLPHVRMYVVNERMQLQPIGVPGELCIGGIGVARGYLGRPELSAEKFVADPFQPDQMMYRTGDTCRWLPDGNLEYGGRRDQQVKIRGYRMELGEIEACLQQQSSVKEGVVVAREDGQGDAYLCAYVVAEGELDAAELRRCMGQHLPGYMIPSFFVPLDELPLTPNGKLDRRGLPSPEGQAVSGVEYVAPRTELEARLCELWQRVLGVERVGVKDNFFDRGGHSLKATTLVAQMHKELNVNVPLRTIFQTSTLEELAQAVAGMEQQLYAAIEPVETRDYYPLSSAQKRMYVLNQLEGAALSYNMPEIYTVEGPLDTKRLERAFRQLIARHESLRTSFEIAAGEPVQRVHERIPFTVEMERLPEVDSLSEAMAEEQIACRVEAFVRPFDLGQAPLLRVGLIEAAEERYVLLFDMHHIISDGVSSNLLVQEFTRLYDGESLPELRIQYKDYAVWQQNLAQSEAMNEQKAFWLETFAGEIPVLDLPADYERPEVQSFEGDALYFEIDRLVADGLQRIAAETGATMYMVLLAAYTILLSKYTGQEDIVVGTPIAGRPHADLEPLIGMFVGTLAMRNYPEQDKPFTDFVREVKERTLKAFENQHYPIEELVEKLDIPRDPGRNPLFSTMFVLQNLTRQHVEMKELSFVPYGTSHNISKVDLTLYAMDNDGEYGFSIEYCTKLFKKETVEEMSRHFKILLSQIVQQSDSKIIELRVSETGEEHKRKATLELAEIDF